MRILIINHYAVQPSAVGITRHYHLAKKLISRGHEVCIVAANYNHFNQSYQQQNNNLLDNSTTVPFVWIPTPSYKGNSISRFWNMLVFAFKVMTHKQLLNIFDPDIIIGSSPHLFAAFAAQQLARRLKKPFILEVRDLWPETIIDTKKFSARHPFILLMKWIEKYLYRQADRIITVISGAHEYFSQYGITQDKILLLPNAIDTTLIPNNIAEEKSMVSKKFILMYAGSHGYANDLDTIIHAAKILQDQKLNNHIAIYLIGDGPEKLRLKNLVLMNKITNITFLDAVPKNEIYLTLLKANAFIMTLKDLPVFRWGVSPNKLFDYMAIGRPTIFAVNTLFNPIAESNSGVTIPASDANSLANAIKHLYSLSMAELNAMGERAKAFVNKYHNINYLSTTLENMLEELKT